MNITFIKDIKSFFAFKRNIFKFQKTKINFTEEYKIIKPSFTDLYESWTPFLVQERIDGSDYNIVKYADFFWGIHIAEGNIDYERISETETKHKLFIGETIEEITYLIRNLKNNSDQYSKNYVHVWKNCYSFDKSNNSKLLSLFPNSPRLKSRNLPRIDLFELEQSIPILILSPAPSRSCNYRCEYCFNHDYGFRNRSPEMESWSKTLITAVEKIKNPLHLTIGSSGEPLYQKLWLETIQEIHQYDHVETIAFVTNLSADPRKKIENLNPKKFGILATFHPSQFKDYERDTKTFIERAVELKEAGFQIAVNYVLIPEQIREFHNLKAMFASRNVNMICNVLRGPYNGKIYPEAYTEEEIEMVRTCHDSTPYVWDYQSLSKSPYGQRCTAGRWGFQLEFDGSIYNCVYSRQKLGNIYDDKVMLYNESCYCDADRCESQCMIGMMDHMAQNYRIEKNMHTFVVRDVPGKNIVL
ncbi:MAG: radical SAM protein [Leptospiraceae bacterium]|nr:radical SAM protein [Leptospiraceae bacterium]MCP5497794.1 radical SAM protein [Leptospiraceae bacterium]